MPGGAKTNANGLAFESKVDLGQFDGVWFEVFRGEVPRLSMTIFETPAIHN
jgi:lipocalin